MNMDTEPSGIPAAALEVIELFAAHAEELCFPDLDAASLSRLGAEVEVASGAVREAEAAMARAREAHRELAEQLLGQSQRALAYARIYAEGNAELEQALAGLKLSQAPRSPERKPKKTNVKRRAVGAAGDEDAAELPFAGGESEAAATL